MLNKKPHSFPNISTRQMRKLHLPRFWEWKGVLLELLYICIVNHGNLRRLPNLPAKKYGLIRGYILTSPWWKQPKQHLTSSTNQMRFFFQVHARIQTNDRSKQYVVLCFRLAIYVEKPWFARKWSQRWNHPTVRSMPLGWKTHRGYLGR